MLAAALQCVPTTNLLAITPSVCPNIIGKRNSLPVRIYRYRNQFDTQNTELGTCILNTITESLPWEILQ